MATKYYAGGKEVSARKYKEAQSLGQPTKKISTVPSSSSVSSSRSSSRRSTVSNWESLSPEAQESLAKQGYGPKTGSAETTIQAKAGLADTQPTTVYTRTPVGGGETEKFVITPEQRARREGTTFKRPSVTEALESGKTVQQTSTPTGAITSYETAKVEDGQIKFSKAPSYLDLGRGVQRDAVTAFGPGTETPFTRLYAAFGLTGAAVEASTKAQKKISEKTATIVPTPTKEVTDPFATRIVNPNREIGATKTGKAFITPYEFRQQRFTRVEAPAIASSLISEESKADQLGLTYQQRVQKRKTEIEQVAQARINEGEDYDKVVKEAQEELKNYNKEEYEKYSTQVKNLRGSAAETARGKLKQYRLTQEDLEKEQAYDIGRRSAEFGYSAAAGAVSFVPSLATLPLTVATPAKITGEKLVKGAVASPVAFAGSVAGAVATGAAIGAGIGIAGKGVSALRGKLAARSFIKQRFVTKQTVIQKQLSAQRTIGASKLLGKAKGKIGRFDVDTSLVGKTGRFVKFGTKTKGAIRTPDIQTAGTVTIKGIGKPIKMVSRTYEPVQYGSYTSSLARGTTKITSPGVVRTPFVSPKTTVIGSVDDFTYSIKSGYGMSTGYIKGTKQPSYITYSRDLKVLDAVGKAGKGVTSVKIGLRRDTPSLSFGRETGKITSGKFTISKIETRGVSGRAISIGKQGLKPTDIVPKGKTPFKFAQELAKKGKIKLKIVPDMFRKGPGGQRFLSAGRTTISKGQVPTVKISRSVFLKGGKELQSTTIHELSHALKGLGEKGASSLEKAYIQGTRTTGTLAVKPTVTSKPPTISPTFQTGIKGLETALGKGLGKAFSRTIPTTTTLAAAGATLGISTTPTQFRRTSEFQAPISISRQGVKPTAVQSLTPSIKVSEAVTPRVDVREQVVPRLTTTTSTITTPITEPPIAPTPTFTPPTVPTPKIPFIPIPPPFLNLLGPSTSKKALPGEKFKTRYTPTVAGILSGKTISKAPGKKIFTGTELRLPIARKGGSIL